MKILIAIVLMFVAFSAHAQPKAVYSVDTITNLASRFPTTGETVAVLNKTSLTNFGPVQFWRHAPYSSATPNGTNVITAINGGRWTLVAVDGISSGAGISGLLVNGSGMVTNLVSSPTVEVSQANGQASFTSIATVFNGYIECRDDSTVHDVSVVKIGSNYLLGISQSTNVATAPKSLYFECQEDSTIHAMSVVKIGSNYLLGISQETNLLSSAEESLSAPNIEVVQTVNQARIFVPSTSGSVVEYVIAKESSAPSQNIWRITGAYIVKRLGSYTYQREAFGGNPICDEGAWEFAVKVSTDPDYVGTYHGYDVLSAAHLLVDGFGVSNVVASRSCRSFELAQRSTVYRSGTTNKLAYKTTRLTFTSDGVRCRQRIEWQDTVTLDHAYVAMMPIERDVGGYQITDVGFVGPACVQQDISLSGHSLIISSTGDFINLWGLSSGVSANMNMVKWPTATHNAWISDSIYYNKLYFDTPSASVTPSTVWESEWTASLDTNLP